SSSRQGWVISHRATLFRLSAAQNRIRGACLKMEWCCKQAGTTSRGLRMEVSTYAFASISNMSLSTGLRSFFHTYFKVKLSSRHRSRRRSFGFASTASVNYPSLGVLATKEATAYSTKATGDH